MEWLSIIYLLTALSIEQLGPVYTISFTLSLNNLSIWKWIQNQTSNMNIIFSIPQTKKQGWSISLNSLFSAVVVKICIIIVYFILVKNNKTKQNKKTETLDLDSDLCSVIVNWYCLSKGWNRWSQYVTGKNYIRQFLCQQKQSMNDWVFSAQTG